MVDKDDFSFYVSWDTAQMSEREVSRYCDLYADVIKCLASFDSWEMKLPNCLSQYRLQ